MHPKHHKDIRHAIFSCITAEAMMLPGKTSTSCFNVPVIPICNLRIRFTKCFHSLAFIPPHATKHPKMLYRTWNHKLTEVNLQPGKTSTSCLIWHLVMSNQHGMAVFARCEQHIHAKPCCKCLSIRKYSFTGCENENAEAFYIITQDTRPYKWVLCIAPLDRCRLRFP